MIVVVADTSPLNYLVQINYQGLLPLLYTRVLIPHAVLEELGHPGTPEARAQMPSMPALAGLDLGESEAIRLAQQVSADLLLMDERRGVRLAREAGLDVTGTIGVLIQAAQRNLIDIDAALARFQATAFRCAPRIFEEAKRRVRE